VSFLKKRGRFWWVYWRDEGVQHGKSLKTEFDDIAKKAQREFDRDRDRGRLGLPVSQPWTKFTTEYLAYSRGRKAPSTLEKEEYILRRFEEMGYAHALIRITPQRIADWFTRTTIDTSKATANVHLRHLKAILNVAEAWGYFPQGSPIKWLKPHKLEKSPRKVLETGDIPRVVKASLTDRPDAPYIVLFLLYTGCRGGELRRLKWADVDLDAGWLCFTGNKEKKAKPVPIHPVLQAVLIRWRSRQPLENVYVFPAPDGGILSRWVLRDMFLRIYEKARLPRAGTHIVRHTFASHGVMKDMEMKAVQEILGHSSLDVTNIYTHVNQPYLVKQIRKLKYPLTTRLTLPPIPDGKPQDFKSCASASFAIRPESSRRKKKG